MVIPKSAMKPKSDNSPLLTCFGVFCSVCGVWLRVQVTLGGCQILIPVLLVVVLVGSLVYLLVLWLSLVAFPLPTSPHVVLLRHLKQTTVSFSYG